MTNVYCEDCKKYHNPKKSHTQIERDIQSKDIEKTLNVLKQILYTARIK